MNSMRWCFCMLVGVLLLPLSSNGQDYQLSYTNLDSTHLPKGRSGQPWDSYVTPIGCDDCDGPSWWSGALGNWKDWLGFGGCDAIGCDGAACGGLGCYGGCDGCDGCGGCGGCDGCGGCGCCAAAADGRSLFGHGIIKPGDKCFDDFISPVTNPIFFEDPRTLTEVRFIFINNNLPRTAPYRGNSVQVYAAQVRMALTERLSLIATKDGFIYSQFDDVIEPGFADISAGLKYNLYRDPYAGRLVSTGFTFEIPLGSPRSLQGNGDGEFNFFLTAGTRLGRRMHYISGGGFRIPVDSDAENRLFYWSNHLDYRIRSLPLYVFTEGTWYHYLSSGNGPPVEGLDLINVGAAGVTGNNIITRAVGLKVIPRRNMEIGGAFEIPVTEREGILSNRWTFDMIFRY